ncbi:head-tail connector protein [Allopusillimonas ginsengisoli]|uniref:head-tail connector protein n=1 Tax=Allopusillimonas ginsengisoli TaxID=453575 RepID=UPI00101FD7C4|nr:head-tail connector protein [Allopusillimonas ginsengisoli]TEA79832.1 phage gp6-like head-tail connector protein [Allopusillimonas ginsengisoli]
MAILTLDQAIAHCRVESDYPADQLLPYMVAAENYVISHLNRVVFESEQALNNALDSLPSTLGAAFDAYQTALGVARQVENVAQRETMIGVAQIKYHAAQNAARRTLDGIVINGAIHAAMLLTLGNLFVNREADVVGASVAMLPTGVPELLRPYRMVQMP